MISITKRWFLKGAYPFRLNRNSKIQNIKNYLFEKMFTSCEKEQKV
ncbi:hypothetical protein BSM4216_3577 [Bacillus smithii]|nr:hypothetical protein BSM4216_3577 [Bacillus smithii]